MEISWDAEQTEAITACCDVNKRVVAVTGKAGTGKTSLIREVYNRAVAGGYRVALSAPTGKAAKRIYEATGIPAVTNHRLLEYSYPGERDKRTGKVLGVSTPGRCAQYPLDYDMILADEYMMVNQEVHRNLFDALPRGGLVRVFGDVNQLRPIEESKRLQEEDPAFVSLLKKFHGHVLNTIHRQGEGSGIVENGGNIILGRMPRRRPDFDIKITDKPTEVLQEYVFDCMDQGVNFASVEHQIIVLGHKSWVGTAKLNTALQGYFREEDDGWINVPRHPWFGDNATCRMHVGDKVIFTQNNYSLETFNGEIGIITDITEYGEIEIDFGDRKQVIPPVLDIVTAKGTRTIDPRKDIDLAYAVTTHKMQGSECGKSVYIMNKSNSYLQNRNNFYTGVTRARQHTCVITDLRSLANSVNKKG